jgi:Domain of unknown function (DUF1707)
MDTGARGFPPGDLRVSDAERDRALSELSEAYQAGRITADEFDRRSTLALTARTGEELTAPLADLPVDRGPVDAAPADTATPRRADSYLVPRLTIGASLTAICFGGVAVATALRPRRRLDRGADTRSGRSALRHAGHRLACPRPPQPALGQAGSAGTLTRRSRDRRTVLACH